MTQRFYLTTPIYYVNDVPHVGHAYCTIALDVIARARRLQGHDVFFLTGTDEHGQNIDRIAREKGVPTQAYTDAIAGRFQHLWRHLDISNDGFIRTTSDLHKRGVLKLWEAIRDAPAPDGQSAIYRDKYAGWYCPRCEAFKDESELRQPGNICPDHERPCEWTEEENYFFRLSAFGDWLRERIESGALQVDPESRRNEVLSLVRQGLQDFSISRAHVKWGIPVPEDPSHVFYVWMDALANYITALGYADGGDNYQKFWEHGQERLHLIGKEIIRFHCLYWPAMLQAAGLPVPTRVFAHGWITKNGRRLSKTTGNVIDPEALVAQYGPDPVRYFLMRQGSFGQDWDFTDEAFVGRFNADLANNLGNLVNRITAMAERYRSGRLTAAPAEARVAAVVNDSVAGYRRALDEFALDDALRQAFRIVDATNEFIASSEPWVLAKQADPAPLDAVLWTAAEALRVVAVLLLPVMPASATEILARVGESKPTAALRLDDDAVISRSGERQLQRRDAMWPRLEAEEEKENVVSDTPAPVPPPAPAAAPAPAPAPAASTDARISIDEFMKVDLRVARVTHAERVPNSKKLVKLQVDLGHEQRTLVAGIAEAYEADALVGRHVAIVANLKPAKLMGIESNGMVLAASPEGGKPILVAFDVPPPLGTRVR
jgi:methionyl-tRNA synthetase